LIVDDGISMFWLFKLSVCRFCYQLFLFSDMHFIKSFSIKKIILRNKMMMLKTIHFVYILLSI
jgi:hypothetical protein